MMAWLAEGINHPSLAKIIGYDTASVILVVATAWEYLAHRKEPRATPLVACVVTLAYLVLAAAS